MLIVDAINPLDFPGGRAFAPRALATAQRIAALATRARSRHIPVIFVNDNMGRWRSDIGSLIRAVAEPGVAGRKLVDVLHPEAEDFVVLKSTLSGFHQTPLEAMLRLGRVESLIVTGFVTGNCILFTAADAYMRDYRVIIPSDCVIDQRMAEHRSALKKMKATLKATIRPSSRLTLR